MNTEPLIITALLDNEAQAHFDGLRRQHFPPERNHLAAHLTLFHALPAGHESTVLHDVAGVSERPGIEVSISGLRLLGKGVAYKVTSSELSSLRARLAHEWNEWLTPQDQNKRELHITVQNKVTPDAARKLHEELNQSFAPSTPLVIGLGVWRYLAGPWSLVRRFEFAPTER